MAWSALGTPVVPVLTAVVIAMLHVWGLERAPLAIFFDENASRDALGLLWQVEAAAIALVVAASLFAFESLTRQREAIPLVEYANRSGLAQFLMLAASGLVVVPVVLFATPDRPSPTAAAGAALVGVLGLVALPFFLRRAMRVVHPTWLAEERLRDIRRATSASVDDAAFQRAGIIELRAWAERHEAAVRHRMLLFDVERVTERSGHAAVVLDIDLDRLEPAAHSQPDQLVAVACVGEEVWSGAALVGRMTLDGPMHTKRAVTISRHDQPDVMTVVAADLFEEGLNAVKRGSPAAAGQVATMYSEVWLAWPRRWAAYGQRLEGGLIRNVEPFTIGPTERLRRNLAATVSRAVDDGLHDHAESFSGVLWTVGFEAVRLGAPDLIVEMNSLARRLLTTESRTYPELAARTTERSWRFQVDLCKYAA